MSRKITDWGFVILAFVFTILMNALANAVPLNGQTTGEISDKFPSSFTPAGYIFSIWGLIYIGLLCFVIYQALPKQRTDPYYTSIGRLMILNFVANGLWIIMWHYDFVLISFFIMLIILSTLIKVYLYQYTSLAKTKAIDFLLFHAPISLYLGWITVATIANFSAVQIQYGFEDWGMSDAYWTLVKLAVAALIAALMVLRHHDIIFVLVVAWAAFGIQDQHIDIPMVHGAALSISILAMLLAIFELIQKWKLKRFRN